MNESVNGAKVIAVSVSDKKGMKKRNVDCAELKEQFGIAGDAHAGSGHRQISLLAQESIQKMVEKGLNVTPGDFAENITTSGFDLMELKIGDKIKIGDNVLLEISQIGKVCHTRCNIYYQAGDCVMPKEGVFARVVKGGSVKPCDNIVIPAKAGTH
jgi:cyclic pyranopterin phosphate synthase